MKLIYSILIAPIEYLIGSVYSIMNAFLDNKGLAIIFVSIVVQVLIMPLYKRADAVQEKERQRQKSLEKWVKHIKNSFKGNERFMMLQAYYKEQNYKPIYALKGTVSLLLQIPFFMAAYNYLSGLWSLNGASFLFIKDLGSPDRMFYVFGLPINILPILMTVINIISGAIYTKGFPLKEKLQLYIMAGLFLALLYNSPAGLVLYWTMNNVFSLMKNIVEKKCKNPLFAAGCISGFLGISLFAYALIGNNLGSWKRVLFASALLLASLLPLIACFIRSRNKDLVSRIKKMGNLGIKSLFTSKGNYILPPILFFVVTYCIYFPMALFLSNSGEFLVSIYDVIPIVLLVSILAFFFLSFVLLAFERINIGKLFSVLLFALSLGFYVQGNFANPVLPQLNGQQVDWSKFGNSQWISLIVWGSCIIIPLVLFFIKKSFCLKVIRIFGYVFAAMQMVVLIIKVIIAPPVNSLGGVVTKRGEFELSENKNIIVFVIDTLDARWFESFVVERGKFDYLDEFTYFDNVVGGGAPTILGMPLLFTGEYYDTSISMDEYYRSAFQKSTLFKDLNEHGYDLKIYTTADLLEGADLSLIANADLNSKYSITSIPSFAKTLYKLGSFFCMPMMFKQYFWLYSGEFTDSVGINSGEAYIFDDPEFYSDFRSQGLSASGSNNQFIIYHLFGVHGPYNMNENGEKVSSEATSLIQQTDGNFKIINEYIAELKANGLWDNCVFIITADHGGEAIYQNPAFLINIPGDEGYTINSAPVTFQNVYNSFAEIAFGGGGQYGEGLFSVDPNANIERIHVADKILAENIYSDVSDITNKNGYNTYSILGYSRSLDSIRLLDRLADHTYRLGDAISFEHNTENTSENYVVSGFSHPEDHFTWTTGTKALMEFAFEKNISDLLLDLSYNTFNGRQRVLVLANGKLVANYTAEGEETKTIIIPADCVSNGVLSLEFILPDAISPSELGISTDERKLALAMRKMQLLTCDN